ncbi:MAG: hypothetical protein ACI8QD_002118 [Cyclobacteriaceae bacterium]|jgi:hypothetical protein
MTSIDWMGIRMDEPVTVLTDLIVSAICFYAFFKINRRSESSILFSYLKFYFLSMGVATALGGIIGHGFLYSLPYNGTLAVSPWKLPGWLVSMFSIALIERASIEYARPLISDRRVFRFFTWLNIVELLIFITLTFTTLNFFFVEAHSAYGLLVVTSGFHGYNYWKTKNQASSLSLMAVGCSALAAVIFMNQWGIHVWFNHFDVSHILMAMGASLFYLSTKKMLGTRPT